MCRDHNRDQFQHYDARLGQVDVVVNAGQQTRSIFATRERDSGGACEATHTAAPNSRRATSCGVESAIKRCEYSASATATPRIREPIATCAVMICVWVQPPCSTATL